jgi:mono/diheme cytochrome c family protein
MTVLNDKLSSIEQANDSKEGTVKNLGQLLLVGVVALLVFVGEEAQATSHGGTGGSAQGMMESSMMATGLEMPQMNAAEGRRLFASKGCVVCHSVNGVGGADAPPLDASTMERRMNPFEFTAKMWRGAEAMIYLQREELGEQVEFTGEEFAHIVAFVHDEAEQKKFSGADIPSQIKGLMHEMGEDDHHGEEEEEHKSD